MPKRVPKAIQRTPLPGTPEYDRWRESIARGMRRARLRRRKRGLLTLTQVSVLYDLPPGFVKRAADEGRLPVVQAGRRRYVRREDAERIFGKRTAA